jgi:hypothetical protein
MYKIAMIIPKEKNKDELEKEIKDVIKLTYKDIKYIYEDDYYNYSWIEFKTRSDLENFCTMYPYEIGRNNMINAFYVHPKNIYLK